MMEEVFNIIMHDQFINTVFRFWNPYFVVGDVLILWGLLVWGIQVEETRLQLFLEIPGTIVGSVIILSAILTVLSVWVWFLFQVCNLDTLVDTWYGVNPLSVFPTIVPVMIVGGIAGIATEFLTGSLDS